MGLFVEELRLGDIGRNEIRAECAQAALEMLVAFGFDDDQDLEDDDGPPSKGGVPLN